MLIQAKRNSHTFIFIVVVVFLIFGKPSYSRENDFEQLRQESSKIKTLQADFVQNKSMKILSKPLVSPILSAGNILSLYAVSLSLIKIRPSAISIQTENLLKIKQAARRP